MNNLIPITENQDGEKAVSARELYKFLEVNSKFTVWCKRMFEYGFQEDEDFFPILGESPSKQTGRPRTDYVLTLDTAKEIAMLQRTDRGKQARKYFIAVEKRARSLSKELSPAEQLLRNAELLLEQERKIGEHDQRINKLEAKTTTRPDYFTVAGYGTLHGYKVNLRTASKIGCRASKICKEQGIATDKCPDPRFGTVKMYPKEVLDQVFEIVEFK